MKILIQFDDKAVIDVAFAEIKANPFKIADDTFLQNLALMCVNKIKDTMTITILKENLIK